jgi:hypothetical protein
MKIFLTTKSLRQKQYLNKLVEQSILEEDIIIFEYYCLVLCQWLPCPNSYIFNE